MAAELGYNMEVAFGASGSPATKQILASSCTLGKRLSHVEPDEAPGSRWKRADSVAEGTIAVNGSVVWNPRVDDFTDLLPFILGGAKTGAGPFTYAEAETLPTCVWDVNKHDATDAFRYDVAKINRMLLRSDSESQLLTCTLDIVGTTDETDGITMPALSPSTNRPLLHRSFVLTLDSTTYKVRSVELEINNNLITDLYLNDQVLTEIPEGVPTISLRIEPIFDATNKTAFYEKAVAGFTGTNTLVWSRGSAQVDFTLGAVQRPEDSPPVNSRDEVVMYPLEFEVREDIGNTVDAIAAGVTE